MKTGFKRKLQSKWARQRGSALVAAMAFVLVFTIVVGYALMAASTQTRNTFRTRLFTNSLAASAAQIRTMTQNISYVADRRPAQLAGSMDNLDTVIKSIGVGNLPKTYQVTHNGEPLSYIRANGANDGEWKPIDDPADSLFGYTTARWSYELVSFMNEGEADGSVNPNADRMGFEGAGYSKVVNVDYVPIYQYAIFYEGDLELHNGPALDVKGRVHTNGNLWLSSGGGTKFYDKVSAVGRFRSYSDFAKDPMNGNKPINAAKKDAGYKWPLEAISQTNDILIKDKASENYKNVLISGGSDTNKNGFLDSYDTNWLQDAMGLWNGNFMDKAMGVRTIRPPLPDGPDGNRIGGQELIARADSTDDAAIKELKMENLADIKIVGNPPNPDIFNLNPAPKPGDAMYDAYVAAHNAVKIYQANAWDSKGNPVGYVQIDNQVPGNPSKRIWTPGEFYDGQQLSVVRTIDIDIGNLNTAAGASFTGGKGVLYASTTPGETIPGISDAFPAPPTVFTDPGRDNYLAAVRITNAETLPYTSQGTGFTMATDRPLYTVGDINTKGTKVTSLLAADSITVMSQLLGLKDTLEGWDPSKPNVTNEPNNPWANSVPSKRVAAKRDTVTNSIFMLGDTPSEYVNGKRVAQSGGAHNVLRYLENWGKKHQFNGSLICLYASQVATWHWRNDSGHVYYNPPKREYFWDAMLQSAVPPPGMPFFLQVDDAGLFQRISKDYAIQQLTAGIDVDPEEEGEEQ